MTEYTLGVFGILAICGVLSLLCYGSGRAEQTALGIIAAHLIISPLVTTIFSIDPSDAFDSLTGGEYETDVSPSLVAEEAFAEGVRLAVADKFSIDKENIRVKVNNFNMEKMSCDKIKLFLDGKEVFADYRGIESYVNSLEMGECKVEILLGKGK